MTELSELFSIREDLREKAFSAKTPEERMHYALLKHACESDILDMANNPDKLNHRMTRQAQTGELRSPHLLFGDCLDKMRDLADGCVDSIVTDPPYGLNFMGKDFDNPKMMGQAVVMHGGLQRYPKGEKRTGYADCDMLMFQDYMTPIFAEALRVARPGAHLLAFGGTRTYHRLACAIEDAGWEIRDCIFWCYGCLDEESQILTPQGCKGIGEINVGDKVIAFDTSTGNFQTEICEHTFLYEYDDIAYSIKSDKTDQLVSKNHRVLIRDGGYHFEFAENIKAETIPVPIPGMAKVETTLARITPVLYKGRMWCVSVPSGAIVARRNGKIFVTGNSGFPKSMDVSKAIAKRAGGDIEARNAIEFMRIRREELGLSRNEFEKRIFGRSVGNVRNWEDGISLPKPELWTSIKKAMELDETPFDSVMDRGDMEVAVKKGSFGYQKDGVRWEREQILRKATTDMAKRWQGFGTTLKPAVEPIVVARKPLEGTVAANVLKYGTGAINIDGCRVPTEDAPKPCIGNGYRSINDKNAEQGYRPNSYSAEKSEYVPSALGRFPANLIHDGSDEVLALFPDTGKSTGGRTIKRSGGGNVGSGKKSEASWSNDDPGFGDSGSAARFFYCAKASRSERGEGNLHPTVKPLALMRYLVRLVTRKGGIVLDPFMGSGTTGVAAIQEGMNFVGIERDPHYYEIASERIRKSKPVEQKPKEMQMELPL